jgi:hypothetical protein
LPEWMAPLPLLTSLASHAGLELEYVQNFHEFYALRKDETQHPLLHKSLLDMKVLNINGLISKDEWDVSRLYIAIKFRKVRESEIDLDDDDEFDNESTAAAADEFCTGLKRDLDTRADSCLYHMRAFNGCSHTN